MYPTHGNRVWHFTNLYQIVEKKLRPDSRAPACFPASSSHDPCSPESLAVVTQDLLNELTHLVDHFRQVIGVALEQLLLVASNRCFKLLFLGPRILQRLHGMGDAGAERSPALRHAIECVQASVTGIDAVLQMLDLNPVRADLLLRSHCHLARLSVSGRMTGLFQPLDRACIPQVSGHAGSAAGQGEHAQCATDGRRSEQRVAGVSHPADLLLAGLHADLGLCSAPLGVTVAHLHGSAENGQQALHILPAGHRLWRIQADLPWPLAGLLLRCRVGHGQHRPQGLRGIVPLDER
ncbi:hypothetical protein WR25_16513 [Diploscapter pachys]|uniref:Uncharacterized protein n=1 Tax=Diploscapter pachys TaxID=2018661 RepID=A0A2A2KJB9_9BILA|nr:hypothetical protein WR25_16513 [Diploscapter pachys]